MSYPAPSQMADRLGMKLLYRLPEVLLAAPERVFLAVAMFLVGVGIVVNEVTERLPISALPTLIVLELAASFMVGGFCSLYGMHSKKRSIERLGLASTAFAAVSYAAVLAVLYGWPAIFSVLIFLALAGAKVLRLLVSHATQVVTQRVVYNSDELL